MKRWWLVAALALLNVVLGVGVYARTMERSAQAQIGALRMDVSVVAGNSGGQTVVYMLDVTTGRLAAFRLDVNNKRMTPIPMINVADLLRRIP